MRVLEKFLAAAHRGEIVAVAIAASSLDGTARDTWENVNRPQVNNGLMAAVTVLQFRLARAMEDGSRDLPEDEPAGQ